MRLPAISRGRDPDLASGEACAVIAMGVARCKRVAPHDARPTVPGGFPRSPSGGTGSAPRGALALALSGALASFLAAPAGAACPADGARYRMAVDAGPEIVMRKDADASGMSDLEIVLSVPGRTAPFRFQPIRAEGYGALFAVPVAPATDAATDDAPQQDTLSAMPGPGGQAAADPLSTADFPLAFFAAGDAGRLVPYAGGRAEDAPSDARASGAPGRTGGRDARRPGGQANAQGSGAQEGGSLPDAASPAPDALFISQLGSNLWYGTRDTDTPVILAQEIWYLDCP